MSRDGTTEPRLLLVDASVFITLADVGRTGLLRGFDGEVRVPETVADEISTPPASTQLAAADWVRNDDVLAVTSPEMRDARRRAESHLGRDDEDDPNGDVALLAAALHQTGTHDEQVVVVTDDKPLRDACKALSIPVSGSIGVLVRAVERGDLDRAAATDALYAMDEVGARLSASLVRRAERLIADAVSDSEQG